MFEALSGHFFRAFFVGGLICLLGQLCFDLLKLTPAHTMTLLVSLGAVLGAFGIYDKLVEYAGFGASLPIVSFGNQLVKGALEGAAATGLWGIFLKELGNVSGGITAAIVFGFVVALFFKPKE